MEEGDASRKQGSVHIGRKGTLNSVVRKVAERDFEKEEVANTGKLLNPKYSEKSIKCDDFRSIDDGKPPRAWWSGQKSD